MNRHRFLYLAKQCFNYRRHCRWLFKPANRQYIRNGNRLWMDRDSRMFHSMMTILCEYIEREVGGVAKATEYIEYWIEYWSNESECPQRLSDPEKNWTKAYTKFIEIYQWYVSTNWSDPVPFDPEYKKYLMQPLKWKDVNDDLVELVDNNTDRLRELSKEHSRKEQEFDDLCERYMIDLVEYYRFLWT